MADIETLMVTIKRPMANIAPAMAKNRNSYGENHVALWRILFRYGGENFLESGLEWQELSLLRDDRFLG